MGGMYPDDKTINVFGEDVNWPGLNQETGKFTDGDFNDPLKKPSFIPAVTINLILDNLTEMIKRMGGDPDNSTAHQLADLFTPAALAGKGIIRDEHGRAMVASPLEGNEIVNVNYLDDSRVGNIVLTMAGDNELVRRRYLPLDGNIKLISEYQRLFDVVHRGNGPDIQAFYQCDAEGVRNSGGLYFKLPNANGRVIRGTGQGDQILDKDNNPIANSYYQGGAAGDAIKDSIRNISGNAGTIAVGYVGPSGCFSGSDRPHLFGAGNAWQVKDLSFNASRIVPTADWNRDASISARICIIY